ncbi:hypothetical protein IFR05_002853 [Cadophora sp. M221]|nr:hypothetical protein IFR05_002853 [Cadophora sp. M221]
MADSEFVPIYMHLQLNTSSPDPIGFGNVSGFYGPGAWGAWFLTLCASWINLLGYKCGFDSSTFMYLLAINGSAIDLFLHLRAMCALKEASDPAWMNEAASVGAAFVFTWWGLCAAISQSIALLYSTGLGPHELLFPTRLWSDLLARTIDNPTLSPEKLSLIKPARQRIVTLLVGPFVPAMCLLLLVYLYDDEAWSNIPALYWQGMPTTLPNRPHISEDTGGGAPESHSDALSPVSMVCAVEIGCVGLFAIFLVCFGSILGMRPYAQSMISRLQQPAAPIWPGLLPESSPTFRSLSIYRRFAFHLALLIKSAANPVADTFSWTKSITVIYLSLSIHPLILSIKYIYKAYLQRSSKPSQSCFFMPCAPQSITELDQAMEFTAGVVSFTTALYSYIQFRRERRLKSTSAELEPIQPSPIGIPFRDEPSFDNLPGLDSEDGISEGSSTRAIDGSDDELLPARRRSTARFWEDE